MITWMQRHKKYLIITIWISTIAFVGAGFVGWGQYSYGDKSGAVAKVGNVEITMGELQKSYSNLYNQYSQMFQGNFDEEKAKSFGLQSQALKNLTHQALVINLAKSYELEVSDTELLNEIKTQEYFFKDGVFNKDVYKQVLSRNNLSIKDYEEDVKKELLIKKVLMLMPMNITESEANIISTVANIANRIEYKVLNTDQITVDTSDDLIRSFWATRQNNYMTEVSYDIKYIKQPKVSKEYTEDEINKYYNENKLDFKDSQGKILNQKEASNRVIQELNAKETKREALRSYIAYKKGELENLEVQTSIISRTNNPFNEEVIEKVSKLTSASPYLKPVQVGEEYYTFKLIKTYPSKTKSYENAKSEIFPLYVRETKITKTQELANNSVSTFKGKTTDFITSTDADKLVDLDLSKAKEFLSKLFTSQSKRDFIRLESGDIVMYNILEQKLLNNTNTNQDNSIVRLKSTMFNEGLIKKLQNMYKTEIFIQGL